MATTTTIKNALQSLPHVSLCSFVTPIERMFNMESDLKTGPIYIKRDDLNGVGPGGNKVRPLEYLLGEATQKGCNIIVASGQQNSNLCAIAASACRRLGLECILVHNNPEPKSVTGNLLLNRLSQVEEHYIGTMPDSARDSYVKELEEQLLRQGKKPYVIENGATMPSGAVGYIHLVLELMQTMDKNPISDLFVPGGNGGFAAGVVFGAALLGEPFHVHVITVEHEKEKLDQIIHQLVAAMEVHLGCSPVIPIEHVMTIHDAYRGDGWGISTPDSDEMVRYMARREGVFIDSIYNAKTFWGMYDLLQSKNFKHNGVCIVHSGGFSSIFHR